MPYHALNFFGTLAEKYFDDMNNDVQFSGKRHVSKSIEGFNRLPEVFTREDIRKCFGYDKDNSVTKKISRLLSGQLIEEINIERGLVPVSYGSLQQVLILCNNNQIAKELLILLYCCHNFILLIQRAKIR